MGEEAHKKWVLKRYRPRFPGGTDKSVLDIFGQYIIVAIKEEAVKASQLSSVIPRTSEFLDSFYYEIKDGSLYIHSSWEWVGLYLKNKPAYSMEWLRSSHPKRRKIIPLKDSKTGKLVFRSAPLKTEKAWVHPAITKYVFIDRGIEKGKRRAQPEVQRYLSRKVAKRVAENR